jgi:hypothetical protein
MILGRDTWIMLQSMMLLFFPKPISPNIRHVLIIDGNIFDLTNCECFLEFGQL